MSLYVVNWNINSIKARLSHLEMVVKEESPDVILLQETKCQNQNFPEMEVSDWGYNCAFHGEKTFNGVAIFSKKPIEDVSIHLPYDGDDHQCRFIECNTYDANDELVKVISVYVPNGQDIKSDKFSYKMMFFDRLYRYTQDLLDSGVKFIIGGDYNVAPDKIDVYDHKYLYKKIGHHPDEIEKFRKILGLGVYDSFRLIHPEKQEFSWWDYRSGGWDNNKGMRIDHILVSPKIADVLNDAGVLDNYRGLEKPSDHAPIYVKLK